MKRFVVAAVAAVALMGAVTDANAQRRSRTTVIESAPAIDASTLLLLGTMGAGTGGASALLPFLLAQPQQTTVIERGGRRWRGRR